MLRTYDTEGRLLIKLDAGSVASGGWDADGRAVYNFGDEIIVADDTWMGFGAAAGRLTFDSTPAPDQLKVENADLNFTTAARGIIHVDGVAAGKILLANGTRYVPSGWSLVGTAGQTYTFPAVGGTLPTGTGVATRVAYWTGVNALAGNAGMTYDAATNSLIINGDIAVGGTVDGLDLSELGDMLFTRDDGLLLLGPCCPMTETSWTSLRGQAATLSGAFHQEAGRWPCTRGLVVEEGTVNLVTNPSIETDTTGYSGYDTGAVSQVSTYSLRGGYSLKCDTGAGTYAGLWYDGIAVAGATEYTLSFWIRTDTDFVGRLYITDQDDNAIVAAYNFGSVTGNWQRFTKTFTTGAGDTSIKVRIGKNNDATDLNFYVDAVQCEQKAYATSYADGSLGTGYTWSGAVHASTSTRTATEVNLDAYASLVSDNNTVSFRVILQVPHDYDDAWDSNYPYVFNLYADADNSIGLTYDCVANRWYGTYEGGTVVRNVFDTTANFTAGDWIDIVVTVDVTNDELKLYVNGVLKDTNTDAITVSTGLVEWNLGTTRTGAWVGNFTFAECAVFDRVLTATEVAAEYALQRPLVDAGALLAPITDGRYVRLPISTDDVSNPPTDAELTIAFGWQPDGFTGLVDDNDAGTTVWKVWRAASKWWYEGLTAAA